MTKTKLIQKVEKLLTKNNLSISLKDIDRPWGAFWYISPNSLNTFLKLFFPNFNSNNQSISPKILLVEANKRLSLQLHYKRSEEWYVVEGPVKIIKNDQEIILNKGESITLNSKENHRLCGLEKAGIVAEIWIHNDQSDPSTEDDIIRLQDDFSRN
jgi:mannose-6-phosphate isomerase-like protein (cupin superfamily)